MALVQFVKYLGAGVALPPASGDSTKQYSIDPQHIGKQRANALRC
jgi:hypothetical protein